MEPTPAARTFARPRGVASSSRHESAGVIPDEGTAPSAQARDASVTLIVPAYNEAASLPTTLPELVEGAGSRGWSLIVVDDGSTDGSADILRAYAHLPGVVVVSHRVRRGYGAAIKSGIERADTPFVATVDADGQHALQDVDALYRLAREEQLDMVVGNRGALASSLYRECGKWLIRKLTRFLVPIPIHDLNSGLKVYRTDLARRYASLCPDSMAFSDVIALVFISERHLVAEHPVTVRQREAGQSTISTQTAVDTVLEILHIVALFNPVRIFLPISVACVLAGVLWGLPIVLRGNGVSVGAMLAITTGILCFALGLIAEQLSQIRKNSLK